MGRNAAILGPAREHPCVRCGRRAAGWHHRVAEGRGGPTDRWNCVPLCGSGTTGCHGWVEHNRVAARKLFLLIPGTFERGRYVGPDDGYRWHYNGERWEPDRGWVDAYAAAPTDPIAVPAEVWT